MDSSVLHLDQISHGSGQNNYIQERGTLAINSRRSACDRCRARKLRCARLPSIEFFTSCGGSGGLPACERCVKAGAECLYTVRRRRAPPWWCGYERQVFKASATFPYGCNLPLDATFGPEAAGKLYNESRMRWQFGAPMPPPPGEGYASVPAVPKPHAGLDHGSIEHSNSFQWPAMTGLSTPDLSAVHGNFQSIASANVAASEQSNSGHSMPGAINDHAFGISPLFSSRQWQEYPPTNSEAFAVNSSNHGSDCGGPVVGPNMPNPNIANVTQAPAAARRPRTRQECLLQLAKLTSQLIVCFSFTEDGSSVELADLLGCLPRSETGSAEVNSVSEAGRSTVGILLESSQSFLDTLDRLKSLEAQVKDDQTSRSSSASPDSDYSFINSPALTMSSSCEGLPMPYIQNGERDDQRDMEDLSKRQEPHQPNRKRVSTPLMLSPHLNKYFSLPTTFTIISCYMWLFRGYEAVFAAIYNALLVQNNQPDRGMQESPNQLSSKGNKTDIPDINIAGVDPSCHPHLQIEMLITLSCQMLQRIEAALGIHPTTSWDGGAALQNPGLGTHDGGVLNAPAAPALLRTFLYGDAQSRIVGDEGGPQSARLSLDSGILQSILDNLRCRHEITANRS